MIVGIACFAIFLVMASCMYTRRLSALLALPIMAFAIALVGGIPGPEILSDVLNKGALKLHVAYSTTMFGAMLAEMMNKQGIAKALIRWVAEFAGDNPFVLGVLLTAVTALLFSTLGGLGAVIMVGTIILPVMLSLGISNVTAGSLFLFGISLGGMFNFAGWQLYTDVLKLARADILSFTLPFAFVLATIILLFLTIELKKWKNVWYMGATILLLGLIFFALKQIPPEPATTSITSADNNSIVATGVTFLLLCGYAFFRARKSDTSVPGLALLTPLVPLLLVLLCHWDYIPAFIAGVTYALLMTWQKSSINVLTKSILDGVSQVIPAVVLMMGIGMLLNAVMHPSVSNSVGPLLAKIIPTHALSYVFTFTLIAPLALYRGPLSLWGMGSGIVALIQKTTSLTSQAIMSMLMSVGQIQGVCDPTNTQNIWVATYLSTDTQMLLRKTIPYVWLATFLGLCLAVLFGFVPN